MGKFLDNRLKYHTASRVGAQTGYSLAQALDPDGHIVRDASVWSATTDQFPMNVSTTTDPKDATDDLVMQFVGVVNTSGVPSKQTASIDRELKDSSGNVIGRVYRNREFPAVELFYQVQMTGVANSDGEDSGGTFQAYEIQENGARVMDWVAPTAVINASTSKPVAGFSGIAEAQKSGHWNVLQKDSDWALSTGSWEFVYMAGIIIFEPTVTPVKKSYTGVRFTGFKYIGETLDKKIENINMVWEED